ncbi:glycosyltransferase family 1 protein [Chlorobaculum sp. 24CR]|uniref:glycosyltransferase n=1 Tax=Chlorobaculum sp. 24CR TaxID=2508878 RepID=UPI00100BA721|nr:glycosyltransferase [Chlorobaculum sp. 24CR]RXK85028.1 glycosyltransferase family 1 protein [Chlorobaculum sp. 24CR]
MKVSILYAGLASPHVGWLAIDELAELLAAYFDAEILSPKPQAAGWPERLIKPDRIVYEPLQTSGGDVLIVVARNPGDLGMINAIADCRKKFSKIYGFVTDSYFHAGYGKETAKFDAITVTAHEDAAYPKEHFGITVHQLYQGTDALSWTPRKLMAREIDITGFGRMPSSYQACFTERFHPMKSPWLYLHSPLGNLTGPTIRLERGMLFKLLHRTRISLAFHLYVEPQGDRPRSMMVTSRWLESLLSGCIVAGKLPVSRMADEMLFWPGATTELSDDPATAADELVDMLSRNDELEEQRLVNITQVITNHDWRYRIERFCELMNLPVPAALPGDIAQLRQLIPTA